MAKTEMREASPIRKRGSLSWRSVIASLALFLGTLAISIMVIRPWLEAFQRWLNERLSQLPAAALAVAFILPSLIVIGYVLSVWLRSKVRQ